MHLEVKTNIYGYLQKNTNSTKLKNLKDNIYK